MSNTILWLTVKVFFDCICMIYAKLSTLKPLWYSYIVASALRVLRHSLII